MSVRAPQFGWWNMTCWEGLSPAQQHRLITHGNLPFGYTPEGTCPNGAEVEVTTVWDEAPGPRFYCRGCAARYLRRAGGAVSHPDPEVEALLGLFPRPPPPGHPAVGVWFADLYSEPERGHKPCVTAVGEVSTTRRLGRGIGLMIAWWTSHGWRLPGSRIRLRNRKETT